MTQRCYHRIVLSTGQVVDGPVVVSFDAEGRVQEWHLLRGEEPMTEWVGGEYRIV